MVVHDSDGSLTALSSQMSTVVGSLQKLPDVLSVTNPLTSDTGTSTPDVGPLSTDGKTAYITVRFSVQPSTLESGYLDGVDSAVKPLRSAGAEVEYGGSLGELARPSANDRISEAIGFGVAILVLLIGFGSLVAAVLPLVTALICVICGLGLLALLAAATTFATVSPTLATMIGLGVGIDYALFLVTRHRQSLMDGKDPVAAAGSATATSGRAVLLSGCTVIIALCGLWVSGIGFIGKLGVAAAVTVVTAVLGALTLVAGDAGTGGQAHRPDPRPYPDRGGRGRPVGRGRHGGPPDPVGASGGSRAVPGDAAHGTWHRYARRVERVGRGGSWAAASSCWPSSRSRSSSSSSGTSGTGPTRSPSPTAGPTTSCRRPSGRVRTGR